MTSHPKKKRQDCLLSVEAVLGLVKHHRVGSIHDLVGDLKSPMRRQAVHHNRVWAGMGKQLGIHLVRRKDLHPLSGFALLAHADPRVGIDDIRAVDGR